MRSLALVAVALLLGAACAAAQGPAAGKGYSPAAASGAQTATPNPTAAKGGSPPPTPGVAVSGARCVAQPTGAPQVLVGGAVYEVADPVHPRLLCRATNTKAHLFTGDTFEYLRRTGDEGSEVVLHSIGSGQERVVAGWPIQLLDTSGRATGDWTPDGNSAATMITTTDASGNADLEVWLFAQPNKVLLYTFPVPLADCICRFGLPAPTVAFSADGQYLVTGWPIGKGAQPFRVFHVSDANAVQTLDLSDTQALWSRTGHTLYLSDTEPHASRTWSPETGFAPLTGATDWQYFAGLSPDGGEAAYTAYVDVPNQTRLGVYVYDFATHSTKLLTQQQRSLVTFVKDGWVWYWGEEPCGDCPGGTAATGPVYALAVATGREIPVVFATGESPQSLQSSWSPGEFWPNS